MKKIIICLMLLICSSISFADFDYSKGITYQSVDNKRETFNDCKVKIFSIMNFTGSSKVLEDDINNFCKYRTICDIKFQETKDFMTVIIIYK